MKYFYLILVFLWSAHLGFGQPTVVQSGKSKFDKQLITSLITYQDQIWMATLGGLVKVNKTFTQHEILDDPEILPGKQILKIIADSNGVWIAGNQGIAHFDGQSWEKHELKEPSLLIRDIATDSSNNLWIAGNIGFDETKVIKWNGQTLKKFDNKDGLFLDLVSGITIDKNSHVWVSTYRGVNKYDGKKWTSYDTSVGLASNYYTGVVVGKNNNVWVSTKRDGINVLKQDRWIHIGLNDGPNLTEINDLIISDEGIIYAISDTEFSSYDGEKWRFYDPELSDDQTITTLEVDKENFYIGTTEGILLYPKK